MIPNKDTNMNPKFFLLEEGDVIKKGDQYYNNFEDKWKPVQKDFIGDDFSSDIGKPVRRINKKFNPKLNKLGK